MSNTIISLKDIVVEFDGQRVLEGLNLDIHDKEFVTFLGPSGCGKTTTLRIIGGFVDPKEGDVFFEGKRINWVTKLTNNTTTKGFTFAYQDGDAPSPAKRRTYLGIVA